MWPNLLEIAIRIRPRERDWMFSSVMSDCRPANTGASASPNACHGRLDRHGVAGYAEQPRAFGRVVQAVLAGIGAGQHEAAHLVRAQRIHRDGGRQRAVDAAGQAQDHARKTVLAHIVAQAEHHAAIDQTPSGPARATKAAVSQTRCSPSRRHSVSVTASAKNGICTARLRSAFSTKLAPSNTSSSWPQTWAQNTKGSPVSTTRLHAPARCGRIACPARTGCH